MIKGKYFKPRSSKSSVGYLEITDDKANILDDNVLIYEQIRIESVQDTKNIFLSNSVLFVADKCIEIETLELFDNSLLGKIQSIERFTVSKAILFSLGLLFLLFLYRYFFYFLGSAVVAVFPMSWEAQIGQNSYKTMSLTLFKPSNISYKKRSMISLRGQELIKTSGLSHNPQIIFHRSTLLGANALAFPGGPIVITDDLVALLDEDDLVLAVIAHEIAHIKERHSLAQIVDTVGFIALASLLFGGNDSVIEELSAVAVNLGSLKNSRGFEKEADLIGMRILENAGLSSNLLKKAIKRIVHHYCEKSQIGNKENCFSESNLGWLSSHPSNSERLEYITKE